MTTQTKVWKLNLYHHIFPFIANGKKTVEGLHRCLPWAASMAEGIGIYYGIAEDWEDRIRKHGIFAIGIHLKK